MATSYTQSKFEIHQPLQEKGMSIQELVAKHMNEEENMAKMSFEGQHGRLSSLFEVIKEESLNYNEDVTLRSKDELEKFTTMEDDAQNSRILVVKENEPTSLESHKKIKAENEIVKMILEMAPWGKMHEELKIDDVTPMSKVEEYIIKLNKEMGAPIVINKEK